MPHQDEVKGGTREKRREGGGRLRQSRSPIV